MDPRLGLLCPAVFALACSSGSSAGSGYGPTSPVTAETFGGSATAQSVDVTMPAEKYIPNHIDIAQGGVVRFVFTALAHDVRFNGNAAAPADVPATTNTTVNRSFANKGTFAFFCSLHAAMTGTVVVH